MYLAGRRVSCSLQFPLHHLFFELKGCRNCRMYPSFLASLSLSCIRRRTCCTSAFEPAFRLLPLQEQSGLEQCLYFSSASIRHFQEIRPGLLFLGSRPV